MRAPGQANLEKPTMKGAVVFAGAGNIPGRALRAIAAAAIYVGISNISAASPFDFLFGGPPAATPPAEAKPSQSGGNNAQLGKAKHPKTKPKKAAAKPAPNAKAAPAPEAEPPPPYDPEILRLAEILGALTYLDALCASNPPGDWRAKMQALLEADAKTAARKERLAGSYNRGFHDYERTYHLCTPNAQAIIGRFLAEGGKIAHEVVNRYGAS
ncbi:MAG: TIGR02301 family protein [Pseudomonadota bacterium]|nr:TIGR02301 family protein [Pseudomonadota bacterium]